MHSPAQIQNRPLNNLSGRGDQRNGARASRGAVLPAWYDQIPTPAENQLNPYSSTVAPTAIRTASGSC